MKDQQAYFRFYAELNDFLPPEQRKGAFVYHFRGHSGIKDPIETLGVPHSEVELIVVNGRSVGFNYQLRHHDRVAVYPVFETFDIGPLVRLRRKPLRRTAFIADVNLGKLERTAFQCGCSTKSTDWPGGNRRADTRAVYA